MSRKISLLNLLWISMMCAAIQSCGSDETPSLQGGPTEQQPAPAVAEPPAPEPEPEPEETPPAVTEEPLNPIPVTSKLALFGTQCPYGSSAEHPPGELTLWGKDDAVACPTSLQAVEFTQPPNMIYLGASCLKKTLTARTQERNGPDGYWEAMVNGEFSLEVTRIVGKLKNDDTNAGECSLPLKVNFVGALKCLDPRNIDDKANIEIEAFYRPQANLTPEQRQEWGIAPTARLCTIPTDCFFWTKATLQQCQN